MKFKRLDNLDALRAVAALSVCLFHFKRPAQDLGQVIRAVFEYGYLGVDVFFVVSGFVIPLMLIKANFTFGKFGSFIIARWIRLYPAFFVVTFLSVLLNLLSAALPGFRGEVTEYTTFSLLANLLLISDFTGTPWASPVFWTLAIEAQYYFLVALSFPWLVRGRAGDLRRCFVLGLWIGSPILFGVGPMVFTWTALFAMGILGFLKVSGLLSGRAFWLFLICAFFSHSMVKDFPSGCVGLLTLICILYLPELRARLLIWLGCISYSIYLLHAPIGGRLINFSLRYQQTLWLQCLAVVAALVASVIVSAFFYKMVERPSHELSRKFPFVKRSV